MRSLNSSAKICAEVKVTIHHNLLAQDSWDQITTVYSKPEVFSQCRKWLSAMGKDRDVQAAASTSKAAEMASQQPGVAAIGSKLAGQLHGLRVLFENIEDDPDNETRFFVIGREGARRSGDDKTAVMFTTAHKPGALAEVLDVFKENGINLTDIEKRPSKKVNWEYYFFIDAQGHQDDPGMLQAIVEARTHCLQLTVLGSYPRAMGCVVEEARRHGGTQARRVRKREGDRGVGGSINRAIINESEFLHSVPSCLRAFVPPIKPAILL